MPLTPERQSQSGLEGRDLRILLVEDDSSDAQLLRLMLGRVQGQKYQVVHSQTLAGALEILAATDAPRVDAVLLDLGLPDSLGLDGLGRVVAASPESPVIVLTGASDNALALEAVASDAQDFLTKWEFDTTLLSKAIRHAIERQLLRGQLTQAKDRAEAASRAKSEFLANMSHEIRTPLNTVLGMAELLRATALNERQLEHVDRLQNAGDHLLALIEDVLDLSRIEAGRLELDHARFDLDELLTGVASMVRPLAANKRIDFVVERASDVPSRFIGDVRRLRQVLINLLGNAVKFTERGSVKLRVDAPDRSEAEGETRRHEGTIVFAVEDTGIGIPKDKLQAIFEQFVQADGSITRRYGGSGLGLAISSNLVKMMGGRLQVTSLDGKGSTFRFDTRLELVRDSSGKEPVAVQHERAPDMAAVERRLRARSAPIRLLLIDDSPDNHHLVDAFLADTPVSVQSAHSGEQALNELAGGTGHEFDIVLCDMHMPGMDGCTFIAQQRAREHAENRLRIPIVALSADVLNETVARAKAAGCDGYLSKPLRRNVLLEALAQHVPAQESHFAARSGVYAATSTPPAAAPSVNAPNLSDFDPSLFALLPRFLENRGKDVAKMKTALENKDFATICTLAHNMKGTGGSYGFPRLSEIGGELEKAAAKRDGNVVAAILSTLDTALAEMKTAVQNATPPATGSHNA